MDYNKLAATALRLLTVYGRDVTLRQMAGGSSNLYNPDNGENTSTTPVDLTRKGLVTDNPGNRIGQSYGEQFALGTVIQKDDKWMYLDANGVAPRNQDLVLFDDKVFKIIDVQTLAPGRIALLYLLVIRV